MPSYVGSPTAGEFAAVLHALCGTRAPAPPTLTSCDDGGLARTYTLVLGYRSGPTVSVDVGPDCHPIISNGFLVTNDWQARWQRSID